MGDSPASSSTESAEVAVPVTDSKPEVATSTEAAVIPDSAAAAVILAAPKDDAAAGAGSDKKKAAACKFIKSTLSSLNDLSKDSGCSEAATGGRRRKRSMRKGRRSSKGGRRSRARKGSKGRKSRGRTIKGGTKMTKELKAWMDRQKKATGLTAISKKTIAATKTKSQATGSEQRSESGKHVVAQARGL